MLQAGLAATSIRASGPATVDYRSRGAEQAAATLPLAGQDFGAYHLVRALGRGGMGAVFEAQERSTGRRLALKVLSHSLDSRTARQRFLREGRLAAAVNHPNSVYVYGTEEIDGSPVITMELVAGGTLQDQVRRRGLLPVTEAVDALLQVVEGLQAAQAVGVLHRDVKPSNCFVDADGQVKIGDFGLSISKMGRGDLHLTDTGVFLGTPAFSSPEQLRGDELDQRSDQYAVGVTLYYLLTGQVPFHAEQMVQLVATVLEKPAPDVRTLRPEVPRELAAVVARCLEKDPARRFRDYADLRIALLPFSSLVPIPASLALRWAAGLIDFAFLALLYVIINFALFSLGLAPTLTSGLSLQLGYLALGLVIWFFYYIVPEGLAGASPGKWLLGQCVTRQRAMHAPGLGRAAVRTLVYQIVPSLPALCYLCANPTFFFADFSWTVNDVSGLHEWNEAPLQFATVFLWLLLFSTARKSNGYAAIHDRLSDTRVILKPWAATRPVTTLATLAADRVQPDTRTMGPFHVLAPLEGNAAGEWHLGYDARLLRKVWIRLVPPGTLSVPESLRDQTRAGRLRWLGGMRGTVKNWDAFEAPGGQALRQLLTRPADWCDVRYWLLDLSEELALGLTDGSLPTELGLDRVWITAEGRAKLFDLPFPGVGASPVAVKTDYGEIAPVRGFLQQVAASGLRGQPLDFGAAQLVTFAFPLPLHARPILEGIRKIERPEVLHAQIERNLQKPTRVTRARHLAPLAACLAILAATWVTVGAALFTTAIETGGQKDAPDLQQALFHHTPPFGLGQPPSPETKAELESYVTGRFGERIRDDAFWQNLYVATKIRPTHETIAKEIVERTPVPSSKTQKEVRNSLRAKGITLEEDWDPENMGTGVLFILLGFALLLPAASILSTLLFRGGLMWHLFSITAVTADGRPAARWRLTWRSLLAWSPWLILMLFGFSFVFIPQNLTDNARYVGMAAVLLPLAVVLLLGLVFQSRSWADRMSGTWLVIR